MSHVITIDPHSVVIKERIGLYWNKKAEALGALMAKDGQNDPIKVVKKGNRFVLVAGLHRLEGARLANIQVDAIEVSGDDNALRMVEVSENLHRRDFGPIEKALFIRAVAGIYEARCSSDMMSEEHARTAAKARWERRKDAVQYNAREKIEAEADYTAETISDYYGWQEDAANEMGMSVRTLSRYLLIDRHVIAPNREYAEQLAAHGLGQSFKSVMEIANIGNDENRSKVIEFLVGKDGAEIGSVAEAIIAAGIPTKNSKAVPATGQTKYINNATANLSRLSVTGWRGVSGAIVERCPLPVLNEIKEAIEKRLKDAEEAKAAKQKSADKKGVK